MGRRQILFVSMVVLFTIIGFAAIPSGYYNSAQNKTGAELKTALHNIIKNHKTYSYADLWNILSATDEDPNNSNNIIELYIGRSQAKTDHGGNVNQWNREHVWAKSHGDFGEVPPAGTDAHHIRPSDVSVNSDRGNKDFDEGGTKHSEATECKYTSTTWEPRNAVKGDIARMMFYMAVRYEGDVAGEPDLELVDYITGSTSNPIFGKLSTLLKWNTQDTVDAFERKRNDVVYSYQNNRNPFIDHPEWVNLVFGSSTTEIETHQEFTFKMYPNPSTESIYFENTDKISKVSVFSLSGVVLMEKTDLSDGINISSLSTGIYIVEILDKNQKKTIKRIYKK